MAPTAITRIWAGGYFIHHAYSPPFGWYRPDTLQTPNGRVAAAGGLGGTLDGPGNMVAGLLAGRRHDNQDRFIPKLLSKFRVRPGNNLQRTAERSPSMGSSTPLSVAFIGMPRGIPGDWHTAPFIERTIMARCTRTRGLEVHHTRRDGGDGLDNAKVLCTPCHEATSTYGVLARARRRSARTPRTERSPGWQHL